MNRIALNLKSIASTTCPPDKAREVFHDTRTPGLCLFVTSSGAKALYFYGRIGKASTRPAQIRLGAPPAFTVEQARQRIVDLRSQAHDGQDVRATVQRRLEDERRREQENAGKTLRQVWDEFRRSRTLKPNTERCYGNVLDHVFADWLDKPIREVTREMVLARHLEVGGTAAKTGTNIGEAKRAYANNAMRTLRSILTYGQATRVISDNPVKVIGEAKQWYPTTRRDTLVRTHQFHPLLTALETIRTAKVRGEDGKECDPEPSVRMAADYLELLLFTGLRREEAAGLRWENIDLEHERTLTIPATETKNKRKHVLPLTERIIEVLTRRKEADGAKGWVFPSKGVKIGRGHIADPREVIAKVTEQTGIAFTPHDLRRTFATVAERLDIGHYTLKTLLNHTIKNEVTGGYIVVEVERLREPMQKISNHILAQTPQAMKIAKAG